MYFDLRHLRLLMHALKAVIANVNSYPAIYLCPVPYLYICATVLSTIARVNYFFKETRAVHACICFGFSFLNSTTYSSENMPK